MALAARSSLSSASFARPSHILRAPLLSTRMGACFSAAASSGSSMSTEEFKVEDRIACRLDASAGGCSGMYWRTKPDMNASTPGQGGDWPRNGTVFQGWKSVANPGWVRVDHVQGYWMPIEQHGKPVVHFDK
mmetsp:Transcript_4810/g.8366  ORF Transcript_4810/g.8366 Transcript_4810/m.8366 type:complete len:132 (-) Transcript_4810:387-782(-)